MNRDIENKIRKEAENSQIENCGFICLDKKDNFLFIYPCDNIAENKEKKFKIDPKEYIKILKNYEIVAIYHTHLNDLKFSNQDINYSEETGLLYIVYLKKTNNFIYYSPNTREIHPLERRPFVRGLWDCYTLCRDYYKINKNINLSYYPFNHEDYLNIKEFKEKWKKEGFIEIKAEDVKKDDIIMYKYPKCLSPNHINIYVGNNKVLDQSLNYISKIREIDERYMKYVYKYMRHKENG